MIAVKLKDYRKAATLRAELDKAGMGVKSASWQEAAGFFAYIAGIIQAVIYGAGFLIFVIVVFILMNMLIIGVLERTTEIGTLRAIGGEKGFIAGLFLWESILLNGSAAMLGIAVGAFTILIFRTSGGIALPDIVQQYLTGGGALHIAFSIRPFLVAGALVSTVSLIATIYPVNVATVITPLKAMSGK